MKIDEIYDFNVKLALWPIWSFLGIIGIISLGLLVYTIGNCFNCESRVSRLEKLSSLWLLATCLWALVAFTVFFFSLVDGSPDFTPPLVFLGCFSIVTAAFAKKLQKGLTIFLFETVEYNTPYTLPNEVLPSQASSPSIKKSLIRALKNSPKALIQLSAAYFKPIPESAKEKRRAESQITKKNQVVPINFFEDSPNIFHKRCNSTENQRVRGFSIPGMSPKNFIIEKCLICMENDSNAVYMDCGHGGICYLCALKIQSNSGDCHICRSPIAHVLKVVKTSGGVLEVVNDELTDRESL